nr:trypsin-like peptidase domain-containing protein [Pedobacter sp. SYSU D00823]
MLAAKKLLFSLVFVFLQLGNAEFVKAQTGDIQSVIYKAIEKARPASVRIWGFDTVSKQQNSAQFSGVVVSPEGHVLTVAHTVKPGNTYKILFPDGLEVLGVAHGRIGMTNDANRPDMGMIKIQQKGTYPFAEMAWSGSLKPDEPCLSIAYPEKLNQLFPTIRFGVIADTQLHYGFLRSTCKMEPGDSGGPLFDYLGRVIALHSRIDTLEKDNYEVPVDLYRKYWTALNEIKDYETLPSTLDSIGTDSLKDEILTMAELGPLPAFKHSASVVSIRTVAHGKETAILGTVIQFKGSLYVLSKSSEVGDKGYILAAGRKNNFSIVARDKDKDLVLLKVKGSLHRSISALLPGALRQVELKSGAPLSAQVGGHKVMTGALSSGAFDLPLMFSRGFFGANAVFRNSKVELSSIYPGSPAETGGLQLGDKILEIGGVPMTAPIDYGRTLGGYIPGEDVKINLERNGANLVKVITMKKVPETSHPAGKFAGGSSTRCDGFKNVFVHDIAVRADECGSPVFTSEGKFMGINIARFSRTATVVIKTSDIQSFLETSVKE